MPCTQNETQKGLAIPWSASDDGTRPLGKCDGTIPYWTNPNIWLDHPSAPSADNGTAVENQVNSVRVKVYNLSGSDINDVNVEAWVCDFTMGVDPASALNPPAEMTGYISTIMAGGSGVVTCTPTWTPDASQMAINGGHVCIAANAYSAGVDGESLPAGGFNFCCNARHGQRNIYIKSVPGKGPGMHILGVEIFVHGLHDGGVTTVGVTKTTGKYQFTAGDRSFLLASPAFHELLTHPQVAPQFGGMRDNLLRPNVSEAVRAFSNPTSLIRQIAPSQLPFRISRGSLISAGLSASVAAETVKVPGGIDGLRMQLKPREQATVKLQAQFSPDEKTGNVHTFDFQQSDRSGTVVGGARVIALIV
jgi:hypothetical protein